jgi:predicted DNA repair protein MutK
MMSIGLLALLDDVAALVKVSAATLDDIPAQVAKTSGKVSGIVIDDAAVTPKYVVGLDPKRELSIIYNIAKKSLINKLVFLGPAALILGFFAPWIIQPILMLGGAYLCFEGYEKLHSIFAPHDVEAQAKNITEITPKDLEIERTQSAVRTDFILSAEIMAITYATVASKDITTQIIVMVCVAIAITIAVYGFVGLIVKADDFGVHLAKEKNHALIKKLGRGIVLFMPHFLMVLGYIGTAAMLWVGAEIIAHGIPALHHGLDNMSQHLSSTPILAWFAKVGVSALGGIILGAMIAHIVQASQKILKKLPAK